MNVHLQLFAVAKQFAGCDVLELVLPAGATVADLRRELLERVPQLAPMASQLMFAVNAEYASDDAPLAPGAEIACIPPVSGG